MTHLNYKYLDLSKLTHEQVESFSKNPTGIILDELVDALEHDPLLRSVYRTYEVRTEQDLFLSYNFFVYLSYIALSSRAKLCQDYIDYRMTDVRKMVIIREKP